VVGRRKRRPMRRIAVQVECNEEFCWKCDKLSRKKSEKRQYVFLYCQFFKKVLAPAFGESVAERCSDCIMAERCADGEIMW